MIASYFRMWGNCLLKRYIIFTTFFPAQTFDQTSGTWTALSRIVALCNRAEFRPGQDSEPIMKVFTNSMRAAFLRGLSDGFPGFSSGNRCFIVSCVWHLPCPVSF